MSATVRIFFLLLLLLSLSLPTCQCASEQSDWNGSIKNRVDADDIIEQLSKGKSVTYGPDSIIVGDLKLSRIKSKSVKGDINISSEILGKVIAKNKIFNGKVSIWDCKIRDEVSFAGSVFSKDATFSTTNFEDELSFDDAVFYKRANFDGIVCSMSAEFRNASFLGYNTFLKASFAYRAEFSRSRFNESGQFQFSDFKGNAYFNGADFGKELIFMSSDFAKDAEFFGAKFGGDALFKSIKCAGAMKFNDNPSFRLKGAVFSGLVSFENSAINYLNLDNCSFSNDHDLILKGCDFYRLNARWDDIKEHIPFDEDVYINLINYYKSAAQFQDADACYRELNHNSEQSAIGKFLWITSDFGTSAQRTVAFLFILSLFFALVYYLLKCIEKKDASDGDLSVTDYIYFSLMVLINFSTDFVPVNGWRWLVLIERLIGWILLAILVITVVRLGLR